MINGHRADHNLHLDILILKKNVSLEYFSEKFNIQPEVLRQLTVEFLKKGVCAYVFSGLCVCAFKETYL